MCILLLGNRRPNCDEESIEQSQGPTPLLVKKVTPEFPKESDKLLSPVSTPLPKQLTINSENLKTAEDTALVPSEKRGKDPHQMALTKQNVNKQEHAWPPIHEEWIRQEEERVRQRRLLTEQIRVADTVLQVPGEGPMLT